MINFLAEISVKADVEAHFTPCGDYPRHFDVYCMDIAKPPAKSYWLDWGGRYDSFTGTTVVLYLSQYLNAVSSESEVLGTPFTIFVRANGTAIFNVPVHPWLYSFYSTAIRSVSFFVTNPPDPDSPSDMRIAGTQAHPRLGVPGFSVKLSESVSGISLNQGFGLSLANNDGFFDDDERWKIFNSPISIKKSTKGKSDYADFREIRSGYVEDYSAGLQDFDVSVSDKFRAMEDPVCNVVTGPYLDIQTVEDGALGKFIPVVYGTKTIKLLRLTEGKYIAAEFVGRVAGLYGADGNSITGYSLDTKTMIITVTEKDEKGELKTADTASVEGYPANRIGEVVRDIITRKTEIPYIPTFWNQTETDAYASASPRVGIAFTGGSVRTAVQGVLKSDMAYLMQQQDGKFTVRRYGNSYKTHSLQPWMLTQPPKKTFSKAAKNYFSACRVNYGFTDGGSYKSFYFDRLKNIAELNYGKLVTQTFDTDLVSPGDAEALAVLLGRRYAQIRQTVELSLGVDTGGMELLDRVNLDLAINGRKISGAGVFVITEINPAQDKISVEQFD